MTADADRARLAAIVMSSSDAIISADATGAITSWNPGAEALFGYSAAEALGADVRLGVPAERADVEADALARVLAGEAVRPYESRRVRDDGTALDVVVTASPIRDGRRVTGVSFIVRDVTASKRVEATFQALLEAAPDAILGVDPDGVIRLVNRQVERLFGYPRDELLGARLEMLVPDRTRQAHPSHREAYFHNPRTRAMGAGLQLAARRKDGTEFPADIALSHLETPDGPIATAAVRDVSEQWAWAERERLQARLHRAQRLESLGQLAGGIAHDFNNLLTVIVNYAEFVGEALHADDERERLAAVHDVEQIRRAADRAAELTRQLLMFSRREVVKREVVDLNGVVRDLDSLLHRTLGEHVVLRIVLDDDLWPVVADPGQMEQVLVNLAVNARDAMPGGGHLLVETANVDIDEVSLALHGPGVRTAGPYVRITVTDSGSGMSPETMERAFDPFFTTKPAGEGTGLGLATVYGVVTDMGGSVGVYSEVGTGTTFRILVPAAPDATVAAGEAAGAEPAVRGHGETILVTEDEDAVRELACRILAASGYEVVAARSADEAYEVVADESRRVDLLLTDVVMPGMSGTELSARAAEVRPALPTVFMSGYSPEFVRQRELAPGVWLVEKPFTATALLTRVREVLADVG